jgi:hypothetical protein
MSSTDLPTIIRNARDDEYESLGRLNAAAFASDPMVQLLCSQVDPDVMLQWGWIDGAKSSVAKGDDTVLVIERIDTNEVIGLASYRKQTRANQSEYSTDDFPKGYNIAEFDKKERRAFNWIRGLTETYGEVLRVYRASEVCPFSS